MELEIRQAKEKNGDSATFTVHLKIVSSVGESIARVGRSFEEGEDAQADGKLLVEGKVVHVDKVKIFSLNISVLLKLLDEEL